MNELKQTSSKERRWINVFGFEEQEAICELGQCNHPLSWHAGVEGVAMMMINQHLRLTNLAIRHN